MAGVLNLCFSIFKEFLLSAPFFRGLRRRDSGKNEEKSFTKLWALDCWFSRTNDQRPFCAQKRENKGKDGIKQAKVEELTESILLKARSVKTAKENIKVRLEMNKESAAAIQELQALGYTVKYKFYRSEKKARKYKAKLTKSSKVYVNTQGEKGRRYYYKARVMIYDQNGKLVDSSKLTQCRYAARIWTK